MQQVLQQIALNNSLELKDIKALQGGDINQVFLLEGKTQSIVVKLNDAKRYPTMFQSEAKGLQLLQESESFIVPDIIQEGTIDSFSYLLLNYIKEEQATKNSWTFFSEQLAKLHQNTSVNFGLDHSNYIGSLVQYNHTESIASVFYINQRLIPQFKLAQENGFRFSTLNSLYKNIEHSIPAEKPSLIHGDLWNGNCFFSEKNEAVLIDPAVAFAPREMDLAMMHLFGGFPKEVYTTYHEIYPLENNWKDRLPIWQLYYLLVHLNLFGKGYLQQVSSIINKYS